MRDYLKEILVLPDSIFAVSSVGEDWEGLAEIIAKENQPWRDKALSIIRNTPEWVVKNGVVVDSRKRQLQNLNGGNVWRYLLDKHFYVLRSGTVVACEVENLKQPETPVEVVEPEVVPAPVGIPTPQESADTVLISTGRNAHLALKTNLLYDAALVPNLALEASLEGAGPLVPTECLHGGVRMPSIATGESMVVDSTYVSISVSGRQKNRCRVIT